MNVIKNNFGTFKTNFFRAYINIMQKKTKTVEAVKDEKIVHYYIKD